MKRVVRPGGVVVLEFDNAIHGLGLGLLKRWTGRERGSLPWEIRQVIGPDCQVTHVYGAVFPVVWRLLYRVPSISMHLEKLAYDPPFNWVAHRIFFRLNGKWRSWYRRIRSQPSAARDKAITNQGPNRCPAIRVSNFLSLHCGAWIVGDRHFRNLLAHAAEFGSDFRAEFETPALKFHPCHH
jgi:hypothetical protein